MTDRQNLEQLCRYIHLHHYVHKNQDTILLQSTHSIFKTCAHRTITNSISVMFGKFLQRTTLVLKQVDLINVNICYQSEKFVL